VKALRILAGIGYPFLMFASLSFFRAREVALVLGLLLAIRAFADRRRFRREDIARVLPLVGLVAGIVLLAAIFNEGRFFLFVPALVTVALLISFARTLGSGPSMVETFAQLQGHILTNEMTRYCRTVTSLWCAFFVLNSGVIVWLALYGSLAWWTAYTGFVSYALIGLLLLGEVVYRAWRFRYYRGGFLDGVLRRVFPPRNLTG
jgi:uncharacterized membrane protein